MGKDSDGCPVDRPGVVCLNCGLDWYKHAAWACRVGNKEESIFYGKKGDHRKSSLHIRERYVTPDMSSEAKELYASVKVEVGQIWNSNSNTYTISKIEGSQIYFGYGKIHSYFGSLKNGQPNGWSSDFICTNLPSFPYIPTESEQSSQSSKKKPSEPGALNVAKEQQTTSSIGMIQSDLKKGSYRAFARQIPKTARMGLLAFLKAKGWKKSWLKTVTEMMETDKGLATISYGLGWALRVFPHLKANQQALDLAEEWCVEGVAMFESELFGDLMQFLQPTFSMLTSIAASAPESPKTRVAAPIITSPTSAPSEQEEEDEEEEEEEKPQKAVA